MAIQANTTRHARELPRLRGNSTRLEQLDRLGWAEGLSVRAYGVRIGIRVSEPGALEPLVPLFPPGWKPAASPVVDRLYSLVVADKARRGKVRRLNLLYGDAERLARERELPPLLKTFEFDLRLYIAEAAPRRVFVHAGVVGWNGRAIVLPGRTLTGKSTLVAALVRAGATYYSDEYAVVDAKGRVHPFSKLISIRRDDGSYRADDHPVEAFGGSVGTRPLHVGLVAVAPYKAGARWRPRRLSAAEGALALLDNAVPARRHPARVLATIKRAVDGATVLKGSRGEASAVAEELLAPAKRTDV